MPTLLSGDMRGTQQLRTVGWTSERMNGGVDERRACPASPKQGGESERGPQSWGGHIGGHRSLALNNLGTRPFLLRLRWLGVSWGLTRGRGMREVISWIPFLEISLKMPKELAGSGDRAIGGQEATGPLPRAHHSKASIQGTGLFCHT